MTITSPTRTPSLAPIAGRRPAATPAPVLADDALPRASFDPHLPLSVTLAPILAGVPQSRPSFLRDGSERRSGHPLRELLTTVAATGLLDVGVDETLGHVNGYGPPARRVDVSMAVEFLAQLSEFVAAAVSTQCAVIDVLARGRRTASNDRLLRALRRGAAVGSLAVPGLGAIPGRRREDGSIVVERAEVHMTTVVPGAALVLPVSVGDGRVVTAWVGAQARGVSVFPGSRAGEATLRLEGVTFGSEEVVSEVIVSDVIVSDVIVSDVIVHGEIAGEGCRADPSRAQRDISLTYRDRSVHHGGSGPEGSQSGQDRRTHEHAALRPTDLSARAAPRGDRAKTTRAQPSPARRAT